MRTKMKIKTKFIISNILLVVIPLCIVLGLLTIFIEGRGAYYWETMEQLFQDKNGAIAAQSIVYGYKNGDDFQNVKDELRRSGYRFSITVNGVENFSNLTAEDLNISKEMNGDAFDKEISYTLSKGNTAVVREVFLKNKDKYDFLAIHASDRSNENTYMKRYITLYIGFLFLILVASVILLNLFLSWWIAASILKPLKKLTVGSNLIKNGNLDFEMTYESDDELGEVIREFDDMRRHLKDSIQERIRYEEYRKELIRGVSHDLRTPLTSIKGYIEGLRDGIAKNDEMKNKYYDAITHSVDSLERLISDLTNFSKWEAGEDLFRLERTELNAFYRSSIDVFMQKHIGENVRLDLRESESPVYVNIDQKEMERVNTNIFENSIKYRVKDESQITVMLDVSEKTVHIRIADDGPGVAESSLEHIFQCFYRGDASRTSPENGGGIGLAVVKQIIEGFHGTVHAENRCGLVIHMELPVDGGKNIEKNTDC